MSLIGTSPTSAQVEGITRKAILDRFLRETGLGYSGVAVTGSTSTINDPNTLKSSQLPSTDWVGGWARISKDAGGASAAPENEHSPITTYDPTTNGRITFDPVMTAAVAVGDSYQLWRYPHPNIVKDILDQCLTNDIYLPCWTMLSEVPDYDMEANNTTDWTASNATVTKVTGTEPVLSSKRWLSVVTTSAGGYARTASMNVKSGIVVFVSALSHVVGTSTTATLQLYDVTNSAEIKSVSSTALHDVRLAFTATIPATCRQIQVRLINTENTVTTHWDSVIVYAPSSNDIALPWWVKDKSQVKGVFEANLTQLDTDTYDPTLIGRVVTNKYTVTDDAFGRGQLRLTNRSNGGISKPLFIFGVRNEVAYATDTLDSKRVDENLLMACLGYRVFEHLTKLPNSGTSNATWIRQQFVEYEKKYHIELRNQSNRLEEIITENLESNLVRGNFVF